MRIRLAVWIVGQGLLGAILGFFVGLIVTVFVGLGCFSRLEGPAAGFFLGCALLLGLAGLRRSSPSALLWAAAAIFIWFGVWTLTAGIVVENASRNRASGGQTGPRRLTSALLFWPLSLDGWRESSGSANVHVAQIGQNRIWGDVAKWLRQGSAKPRSPVRIRSSPPRRPPRELRPAPELSCLLIQVSPRHHAIMAARCRATPCAISQPMLSGW